MQRDHLQKVRAGVLASCPVPFSGYFLHQGLAAFSIIFMAQVSVAKEEIDGDGL